MGSNLFQASHMLNYILPPIIIIISFSFLIIFLFRKAEQIPTHELLEKERTGRSGKMTAAFMSAIGQFGLKVLERIMHKSKLMSLKFHNMSNDWFQTIREKRQNRVRVQQEIEAIAPHEENELSRENQQAKSSQQRITMQTQHVSRPMVREMITKPESAKIIKRKSELEGVLIRRIAINPKDIEAYERLGDYYLESENFLDSLECFKQVLVLSPTHQKARLRIRRLEKIAK